MPCKKSQNERVLKALLRKKGLTSLEAALELGITALHRRLSDLEEMGVVVDRVPVNQPDGTHFKRYFTSYVPASVCIAFKLKNWPALPVKAEECVA